MCMGSLGAVEGVGGGIGFHLLGGGVGVGEGDLGGFAQSACDQAVREGEERGCDEGNAEDVANMWLAREGQGKTTDIPIVLGKGDGSHDCLLWRITRKMW